MKHLSFKIDKQIFSAWRNFLMKFVLLLGIGVFVNGIHSPTPLAAQTETAIFPGKLVAEGIWEGAKSENLLYVGHNRLLGWNPAIGQLNLWQIDPIISEFATDFPARQHFTGSSKTIISSTDLHYLGGDTILAWSFVNGQYQIQPLAQSGHDPLPEQASGDLHLSELATGQDILAIGHGHILILETSSNSYQIFGPSPILENEAPSLEKLSSGTWPTSLIDHQLVYLGYNRILDREVTTGKYQIWHYEADENTFRAEPGATGTLDAIGTDEKLMRLGHQRLMAWQPVTGAYRIWRFELGVIGAFSPENIANLLAQQALTGLTPITHGFSQSNDGDSLGKLADAILAKSGGWILDYEISDDGDSGFFDSCTNDCQAPEVGQMNLHEVILLFDWATETNELSDGWGEAAGDALFSLLIKLGLINPAQNQNLPIHFIGHSFGTAVTSEAIERLSHFDVPVDHVTYLDPHDFDQDLVFDDAQRLYDLGKPVGYGASVWRNVDFAEVYYQTRGKAGKFTPPPLPPNGRPIPGAYNKLLLNELPNLNAYDDDDFSGDHGYVWKCYYLGSILGHLPSGCAPQMTATEFSETGYAYSRIANAQLRPAPNFYSPEQHHLYSNDKIVNLITGEPNEIGLAELGLTSEEVVEGRWGSDWNSLIIVNGDFAKYNFGYSFCSGPVENTCPQPGWSHHGGGGDAHFDDEDNGRMELDAGNTIQTHNWFYIPTYASILKFDLKRKNVTSADMLEIHLGNQPLASYWLNTDDADYQTYKLFIPAEFRGTATTLTFKIVQEGPWVGSQARIDNVGLSSPPEFRLFLPIITTR